MPTRLWLKLFVFVFFLSEQNCLPVQDPDGSAQIKLSPESVNIDAFYKGLDVIVNATIPKDCDGAAVKIQGDDEKAVLNRKGKISILWLNVAEVTVANAPGIYILDASSPLNSFCTFEEQKRLTLGYAALRERIVIHCEKPLSGSEFDEFILLKEHNGSYRHTTSATLLPAQNTSKTFSSALRIPPVMPSGNYLVRLYCFKNLVLMGQASAELSVEKVGIPNYLHSLAYGHPAVYGLLAIVIAMATGIIMGMIFSSRARGKR